MEVAIDPLGRTVQLTEERWSHIIEGHLYMAPYRADVIRAIEAPTQRTVHIGPYAFDHVRYNHDADVLYLSQGDPARAVDFDETPGGHAVSFDENGDLVGLTGSTSASFLTKVTESFSWSCRRRQAQRT